MERILEHIGRETDVDDVARHLYQFASEVRAPVTGALHVTCSDESERECVDAFQRSFCEYVLPTLKFGERATFRTANLGGRYEWGAVAIADDHYSMAAVDKDFKLLVVKVNAHVSVDTSAGSPVFGQMRRYDSESVYCGALHSLMAGARVPFADDLREALSSEGQDRLALLLDEERVDPAHRSLFAAVASARLQARRALLDLQDQPPRTPTLFTVIPCVTLNRRAKDAEIVCGIYRADWRDRQPDIDYQGLGDDPSAYRLLSDGDRFRVEDDQIAILRKARDHRELVVKQWLDRGETAAGSPDPATEDPEAHRQLDEVLSDAARKKHHSMDCALPMLKLLLHSLALVDPIAGVVLLFGQGLVDIHHHHKMHRLSLGQGTRDEAREVLGGVAGTIDRLPPKHARYLLDFLHGYLGR
jgi:hypothetical protein